MSSNQQLPRYIAAYRLSPDEFWDDVARVFQSIVKLDKKPIRAQVVDYQRFRFNIGLVDEQNQFVGAIWAERFGPTHIIPADYIYDILKEFKNVQPRYGFMVTAAEINAGAKIVAKRGPIHLVDGAKYERMRAKAYGWGEQIKTPIYFDGSPKPVNPPHIASEDEMQRIYAITRNYEKKPVTHTSNAADTVIRKQDPPQATGAQETLTNPSVPVKTDVSNQIGELSLEEQAVILAWRRGDKLKAAKIILND